MGLEQTFRRLLRPLERRVMLMISRCVLKAINDGVKLQEGQVAILAGEHLSGVERFQEYGFTSHPHPGAEGIVLCLMGNRDHPIIIAVDDRRYRLTGLAEGEVALYDDQGQKIVIHRDRIEVTAPKVVVRANDINVLDKDGGGTAQVNLTAAKAVLNCPDVHLGGEGGAQVARIGDRVDVGAGSSAGLWPIVEGSAKVRAAT